MVIERKSIGLVEVFVDDVGCCVRRRGPSERRLRCGWAVRPVPALARGPKNEACTRKHARRRQRGKGGCKGGCGTLNSWRKRVPAVGDGRGSGKVSVDRAGAVGRGRTCFAPQKNRLSRELAACKAHGGEGGECGLTRQGCECIGGMRGREASATRVEPGGGGCSPARGVSLQA